MSNAKKLTLQEARDMRSLREDGAPFSFLSKVFHVTETYARNVCGGLVHKRAGGPLDDWPLRTATFTGNTMTVLGRSVILKFTFDDITTENLRRRLQQAQTKNFEGPNQLRGVTFKGK